MTPVPISYCPGIWDSPNSLSYSQSKAHMQLGPSIYAGSSSVCWSTQAVLRTGQNRTRQNWCCPLGAEQCTTEKKTICSYQSACFCQTLP